jgi:hypothetical protein
MLFLLQNTPDCVFLVQATVAVRARDADTWPVP